VPVPPRGTIRARKRRTRTRRTGTRTGGTRRSRPSASLTKPVLQVALALIIGGALLAFVLKDRAFRTFDNLLAGIGVGAIIVALWFVSGSIGFVPEHPSTLEEAYLRTNSGRMEALSFVAPVAYSLDYLMFFSDTSKVVTIGVAAVAGVLAGSAAYAVASGRFRWEGFRDTEDMANHLVGGALMGFGGVAALGCTVGQGLSGISTLALGSFAASISIVAGAMLALKYQSWRLDRIVTQEK